MGTQIRPIPPPIEMRPRWGGITHQAKSWLRLVSWGGNRKSGGGILRKILAIPPHHGGGIGEMTKFWLILGVFAQNLPILVNFGRKRPKLAEISSFRNQDGGESFRFPPILVEIFFLGGGNRKRGGGIGRLFPPPLGGGNRSDSPHPG